MSTSAAMPKTSPSTGLESEFTCGAADFTTFWLPPSTAIVAAVGELDAANAAEFTRYAWRSGRMTHLVVDLSGVEFCGSAGYSALLGFGVQCAAQGVEWSRDPTGHEDRNRRGESRAEDGNADDVAADAADCRVDVVEGNPHPNYDRW